MVNMSNHTPDIEKAPRDDYAAEWFLEYDREYKWSNFPKGG
jgi:hypothetical protein